jgi:lysophospholipase L1-like esterase
MDIGRPLLFPALCVALSLSALSGQSQVESGKPVVVVLGSSSARGLGATSEEKSWAGRLKRALDPLGYTVVNLSRDGYATAGMIARFPAEVAPLRPKFVIHAVSIFNEGFSGPDPERAARTFRENTRTLVAMTRELRAVPIVAGLQPADAWDPGRRAILLRLYEQLEADGLVFWDFFGSAAELDGRWQRGLTLDGLHPNDEGHATLFESLTLGVFPLLAAGIQQNQGVESGAWIVTQPPNGNETPPPMRLTFDRSARSWTACIWFRDRAERNDTVALFGWGRDLRLDWLAGKLTVSGESGVLLSADTLNGAAWTHTCVSHQRSSKLLRLFINGKPQGETVLGTGVEIGPLGVTVGGVNDSPRSEFTGGALAELAVYRSSLPAEVIEQLYRGLGDAPRRSLEALLPLSQEPGDADNRAPGRPNISIREGAFLRSPGDGPRQPSQVRDREDRDPQ